MKFVLNLVLVLLVSFVGFSQEICDNGIDDDSDGLIDLQDTTDCFCVPAKFDTNVSSLIPNPSFELRTCCPSTLSQLNCANNWVQASPATSDYFNTCGIQSILSPAFALPPTPLPNGVGYVGFYNSGGSIGGGYKEYVGTCLTDTMRIGVNYQIEFFMAHSRGNLTTEIGIFGTTNCTNLPFGGFPTPNTCPTVTNPLDWTLLDFDTVTCSTTAWTRVTLNFTPTQNYTAIVLGGTCTNNPGTNYYFADNLVLNKTANFRAPVVNISDTGHYCRGNLVLKANYDTIPKFFQWYKDSIAILGATDSTYNVPNGGTGAYQVQLTYDSNCVITNVFVVDTTIIEFELDSAGTCPLGAQTGEIIVSNIQSGTSPYQFQLNSGPFLNDTLFSGLSPGFYLVSALDSNGCVGSGQINVDAFDMPTASFITDSVCLGFTSSFIDQSTIPSGLITRWEWSIPGNPTVPSPTYTFSTPGNLPITLTVTSDSGCIDDTTINSVVYPLPTASFVYTPQELYTFNPDVCFINQSTNASTYSWDFDFPGVNGTSVLSDPCTVRFPTTQEKTYRVELKAFTAFGCVDSTTVNVTILDEFLIYIPNAISLNADGLNDEFAIVTAGVQDFSFKLFNRWGEIVFQTSDVTQTWDGKHKGVEVPVGTYVYRVIVKGENGDTKEINGHLNVVK